MLNNSSGGEIGNITGSVTINNDDDDDIDRYATLSFRADCPGASNKIEVLSVNIVDGSEYRVVLPVGEYSLIASPGEVVITPETITVGNGISTTVDVVIDIPTS